MPDLLAPDLPLACGLVTLAAVVRGFSGFGSAMIVMPGLSLLYPPVETLVVFVLIEMAASLQLLPQGLRDADRRLVLPLAVGATLCLPLGWQIMLAVEPETMRRAIALIVLLVVALLAVGWRYRGRIGPAVALAIGGCSGLLGGSTGMAGPPVILMLMSAPGSAAQVRGSLILYFTWLGVAILALVAWSGELQWLAVWRAAVLLPFYLVGIWLGSRAFRHGGERHYRWAALVILGAVALTALLA